MARHEVALHTGLTLGEGPFWDTTDRSLWCVDVEQATVHRFDPRTGAHTARTFDAVVGTAVPAVGGGFVVGLPDGVHAADLDGSGNRLLAGVEGADDPTVRVNDAKCDPAGRLWVGTIATDLRPGVSTLYRLGAHGAEPVVRDLALANGLGWSPAGDRMYLADSRAHRILAFDYDVAAGTAVGGRTWLELPESTGYPDGLTVDAEGGVWVAMYLGAAVHRYDPGGALTDVVALPVTKVTSVCFGGAALTDLYVTTACAGLSGTQRAEQPLAGDVLVVPDAGRGLPGVRFDPGTLRAAPTLTTGGP